MDTQVVRLELPAPIYHAAQRMSKQTRQSVEQLLQTTLAHALLSVAETVADEVDATTVAEMEANNREYERLHPELERDHWGSLGRGCVWQVARHGRFA